MGRRKQKSSESVASHCNGDSSESGRSRDPSQAPEKKSCIHINKAVDQTDVRKYFKNPSNNFLKCGECDSQDLCVCLKCGVSLCTAEHALKHELKPRSDLHCLMLDTTKWNVWCYKCNCGVQVDASKKLKTMVDYVQTHFEKAPVSLPSVSTVAIPLCPPLPCDKKQEFSSSPSNNKKKALNGPVGKQTIVSQPCKIRGLSNLGNTCFFNSVLQCLAQTPNLVEFLNELKDGGEEFTLPPIEEGESETEGRLDGWGPLTEQLARSLAEISSGGNTVYSPRPLLEELRKKCPQFRGYEQHDSHELLRELLNAVRTEDLKRYRKEILMKVFKTTKVNPSETSNEDKARAKKLDQKISDMVKTKPIDVFQGRTECVHECQDCNHRTRKIEPFMDLSLPVLSEKPQPPHCKKNREDSTSEEPKMSKHQMKKLKEQRRKGQGNKGKKQQQPQPRSGYKYNSRNNSNENEEEQNDAESLGPNTTDKSNGKSSSDSEKLDSSPVHPCRQESGYNSDKAVSPGVLHTAQAFMDTYSYNLLPPPSCEVSPSLSKASLSLSKASSSASFDEDFPGPPGLFDEDDVVTAKSTDQKPACSLLDFDSFSIQDPSNEPTSPSHIYVETYSGEPWPPGPPELTMEALKQSDLSSRSSSQFHESGFGSQSIDEVSSTHPSEGMCSTGSCNGGPSLFGDEFQHVENKTSIPESGIGSMTEELATMSIIESDGEANASPDSMQANRSSGSMHTLSPYSDDSSQKKNILRSCNSLSNLSGEDCYVTPPQPCFDHAYLSEKLLGTSHRHTHESDENEEELEKERNEEEEREEEGEREEKEEEREEGVVASSNREDSKENVEEQQEEEVAEDEDCGASSVGNGYTLSPRPPRQEGECSLLSCLNQYTCIELLAGNNKVTCEMCTKKHNRGTNKTEPVKTAATLQTLIVAPPSVLICHLKRFQLTYSSLKKITKSVPFPMKLNIGSFCSSKCQGIPKDQTDVQYSLYGIVEHSGSLHGGHYVAYVKTSSGQWYYASDSRVNPVSEDKVLKAEAYLLFYHMVR